MSILPSNISTPASRGAGLTTHRTTAAERRLQAELRNVQGSIVLRTANVVAEGTVATQKMREVDYLARQAITGQIMLARWADSLAGNNQLLHDEIGLFRDVARMGKAQIMSDVVDTFAREGRM